MAVRNFMDPEGREWRVWNVTPGQHHESTTPSHLPDDMVDGWLCFQSGDEKRRVAPVPADWQDRSDGELWGLCGGAVRVGQRPPMAVP